MNNKRNTIKHHVEEILKHLGEDPKREGLLKTPERYSNALKAFTQGYSENAEEILRSALFHTENYDMVLVKNIDFYSLCEHHMLPFFGRISIAYIPNDKVHKNIVGLSKLHRLVDVFARRLQTQETMTEQISNALVESLKPKGVAIIVEARHMCMELRGVKKVRSSTHTRSFNGVFEGYKRKKQ